MTSPLCACTTCTKDCTKPYIFEVVGMMTIGLMILLALSIIAPKTWIGPTLFLGMLILGMRSLMYQIASLSDRNNND